MTACLTRRGFLTAGGVTGLFLLSGTMHAEDALASAPEKTELEQKAEAQLRVFLSGVIGKAVADRSALAEVVVAAINPFDSSSLLVEGAAYGVLVRGAEHVSEILKSGYHKQSKQGLTYSLQQMPNSPWTHVLNGAWHFEAARRSTIGSFALGASRSKGEEFFEAAEKLNSSDPGIYLAMSISYLSDKPKAHRERAEALLSKGVELCALPDAENVGGETYLAVVSEYTTNILERLSDDGPSAAQEYVLEIF